MSEGEKKCFNLMSNLPEGFERLPSTEPDVISIKISRGDFSGFRELFFGIGGTIMMGVFLSVIIVDSGGLLEAWRFISKKIAGIIFIMIWLGISFGGITYGAFRQFKKVWLDISPTEIKYYRGFSKKLPIVVIPRDGSAYAELYNARTYSSKNSYNHSNTKIVEYGVKIYYRNLVYDLGADEYNFSTVCEVEHFILDLLKGNEQE